MHFQDVILNKRTTIEKKEINEFKPYVIDLLEKAVFGSDVTEVAKESGLPTKYVEILARITSQSHHSERVLFFMFDNGNTAVEKVEIVNEKRVFHKVEVGNMSSLILEFLTVLPLIAVKYVSRVLAKCYENKIQFNDTIQVGNERLYGMISSMKLSIDDTQMTDIDFVAYRTKGDVLTLKSLDFGPNLALMKANIQKLKMKGDQHLVVSFPSAPGRPTIRSYSMPRFNLRLFSGANAYVEYADMSAFGMPDDSEVKKETKAAAPLPKRITTSTPNITKACSSVASLIDDEGDDSS